MTTRDFFAASGLRETLLTFAQDNGIQLKDLGLVADRTGAGRRKRSASAVTYVASDVREGVRARRQESVFELPVATVAEQLTLIEFDMLEEIRLDELCNQAWNKNPDRAPNVIRYIEWFNRVSHWVATQILSQDGAVEVRVANTHTHIV